MIMKTKIIMDYNKYFFWKQKYKILKNHLQNIYKKLINSSFIIILIILNINQSNKK